MSRAASLGTALLATTTAQGLAKVQALSQTIEAHYAWLEQELGKIKLKAMYELLDGLIALETVGSSAMPPKQED
jgi:fructose-specific phosphotransferase system IIC component